MARRAICIACRGRNADSCTRCEGTGHVHPEVQAVIDAAPPLTAQQVSRLRPLVAPIAAVVVGRQRDPAA